MRLPVLRQRTTAPASVPFQPSREELLEARQTLARILTENIVPFWCREAIDWREGGYRLNHDLRGRWKGRANKHVITQTRTLWFFSRLARSALGTPDHLAAARHGYEFVRDHLWDRRHGGIYWEVDSSGRRPTRPCKHLLSQAHALYGLTEYAKASGDAAALTLARQLVDLLEQHAYDPSFGGYREFFAPDWGPPPAGAVSYTHVAPDVKSFMGHLHLMEALTSYYRVTGDPGVRARLVELVMINGGAVVRKRIGACTDKHQRDWTPLRGADYDRVVYGHDVENVWMLIEACAAAGLANGPLLDLYRTLFQYALGYGFDQEQGGFYESGPFNAPADGRDKVWWVQAEALLAALHLHRLTGDKPYFTCFSRTLRWIADHQVDWSYGDWHARVSHDGQISGDKAGTAWKDPYHQGRAMIEALDLMPAPAER